MSKLFKLKEWVTIPDAQRHFSQIFNEPVSDADVLQMGVDGHIKLSVIFPNHARAKLGRVIPFKDVPLMKLPPVLSGGDEVHVPQGYPLHEVTELTEDTPFIHFSNEVVTIDGLWDLAMMGNELIDIEYEIQQLIGGPEVTLTNIDGTFLNRLDGTWASLQEQFEDRTTIDADGKKKTVRGSYYPAGGLGTDCTRVIRTSEILALQSRLDGTTMDKPLATRERDTLLTIIAALCKDAGYDYTKHAKTAGLIHSTATIMGASIGETTIEGHLKKIPDALATRMK